MKKGLLTGLLLFGFFFGAGNLIFPPALGLYAGENFWPAILGFVLSGVGLAILTLIVGAASKGSFKEEISKKVSPGFALLFLLILYLSIGPFFAIPRTATVSYSIGLQPFEESLASLGLNHAAVLLLYTLLYFGAAYLLAYKRSSVLNSIGKILTPLFAGLILLLAILSVFKFQANPPMAASSAYQGGSAFFTGFIEGYNTLDALAAVAFCLVAVNTLKQFSFKDTKDYLRTLIVVGAVTALGFSLLYLGLANLGNHYTVPEAVLTDATINKGAYVLAYAAADIFGTFGQLFLGVMVILTCITTTVGLIVSCSDFFAEIYPRLSYRTYATLSTLVGFAIANLGLNAVIQFSLPVLLILYPVTIVIVVLILLNKWLPLSKLGMRLTVYFTVALSLLSVLATSLNVTALKSLLAYLPFFDLSLEWCIPALILIVLSLFLPDKEKSQAFVFHAED